MSSHDVLGHRTCVKHVVSESVEAVSMVSIKTVEGLRMDTLIGRLVKLLGREVISSREIERPIRTENIRLQGIGLVLQVVV